MKKVTLYLLLLLLSTVFSPVEAAPVARYYSYDFNVAEGLSSNIVYSIIKWKDNNVWMATRQGIDRYDGFSYKHYSLFSNDLRMVWDGHKISITYDGQHQLWAYTDGGRIYCYDIESDSFQPFVSISDLGVSSLLHSVTQIDGRLYACTSDGVCCIDIDSARMLSVGLEGKNVRCIRPYVKDRLVAGGPGGLVVLTDDLKVSEVVEATRDLNVECIYVDNERNRLLLGCYGSGVWIYKKGSAERIEGPLNKSVIRCITEFDDSSFLIGCDGLGVYKVDKDGSNLELFASDQVPSGSLTLRTSSVYSILVDDVNVWVACYRGGVTLFRKNADFIFVRDEDEKVMSANFVHGACGGKGDDIWIAFNSSIGHYDFSSRTLKKYLEDTGGFLTVSLDEEGYVWCGGYNTGVFRMNSATGVYRQLPSLSEGDGKDCVSSMARDADGNIWIGGLNFDLAKVTVNDGSMVTKQFELRKVFRIIPVSSDTLLVGTPDGLSILNPGTGEISTPDLSDSWTWKATVCANSLSYLEDTGDVWIGTDGGGLLCYNMHDGTVTPYTTGDGLPSNYIMALEMDSMQRLWASTENSGIFVFDTHSRKVISSIKRNEGLFFNEFFPGSSAILPNGDILFGGYKGAIVIPTLAMPGVTEAGNVSFTNLTVGSETVSMKSHPHIISRPLNDIDEMTLPYNGRSFALSISTDNLYNQHSVQLYWRLLGYSKEWQVVRQDHTIEVSNLAPGRYVLEIVGEQKGDEASTCRKVSIKVEQSIWLRWYFILLYAIVTALLVNWVITSNRHKMEKRQFEDKIRFFGNVAHDIKTPLMLVSAPLAKLAKMQNEQQSDAEQMRLVATASNNVKHLENLVGQLMDFEKLSAAKNLPEARELDLAHFLGTIKNEYQTLAEGNGLSFQVNIPQGRCIISADPSLLHRVLDNLLSNAIKYTLEGDVTMSLHSDGDNAVVEVSDTGIGMSSSTARKLFHSCFRGDNAVEQDIPGNGVGLFFTHALVRKMGGSLSFRSKLDVGTSFYLSMPLCKCMECDAAADEHSVALSSADKVPGFSSNRETILLVDDNDDLREFLAHSLADSYNIMQAPSAEAALDLFEGNSVDLVITDLMMPGMHGDALCKHIKGHVETSHIPVILLTAVSDKDAMTMGLSVGADDYISKPVGLDILYLKVRNIFTNRQKMQAYFMSAMNVSSSRDSARVEPKPLQGDIDNALLQKIMKAVQDNLSNSELSVNDICREVGVSRTLLYEKTRKLLGLAPNDLIRETRMKLAKSWLEDGGMSVTEVAYQCGFSDVRYFSTVFKKYYGISPSNVKLDKKDRIQTFK